MTDVQVTENENMLNKIMTEAMTHLANRDYLACERACETALEAAVSEENWIEAARIVMPLQECRRIRRQVVMPPACHLPQASEIDALLPDTSPILSGHSLLLTTPMQHKIAMQLWQQARESGIFLEILLMQIEKDTWHVYGLIEGSYEPLSVSALTLSDMTPEARDRWFQKISEDLGDQMIASLPESTPLAQQLRMIQSHLIALPDHEKLLQKCHDCLLALARKK